MDKMKFIIASSTEGKVIEYRKAIKNVFGDNVEVYSMKDFNINPDIDEKYPTFRENAMIKAVEIMADFDTPGYYTLAEDSGLVIDVLSPNNKEIPGTRTARYAMDKAKEENNLQEVERLSYILENEGNVGRDRETVSRILKDLEGVTNRNARFTTFMVVIAPEGEVYELSTGYEMKITEEERGSNGFSLDVIMEYEGKTLAEMSAEEKSKISGRERLIEDLKTEIGARGNLKWI